MRDLRLRALQDAPLAFGSTYAREAAFEPEVWEQRTRENAAGERSVAFLLEPWPGMAVGASHDDEPGVAHLYGMWVAPEARGAGAGRALVEAVIAWATDRGAQRLMTAVEERNAPASALYERAGFTDTGRPEPLGYSDATVVVLERAALAALSTVAPRAAPKGSIPSRAVGPGKGGCDRQSPGPRPAGRGRARRPPGAPALRERAGSSGGGRSCGRRSRGTPGAPRTSASAALVNDHPARSTRSTNSSRRLRLSLALVCSFIRCPPWDWWLRHQPASKEARMNNVAGNYT
jgi:GNAT superfamily N-acetyltransferase